MLVMIGYFYRVQATSVNIPVILSNNNFVGPAVVPVGGELVICICNNRTRSIYQFNLVNNERSPLWLRLQFHLDRVTDVNIANAANTVNVKNIINTPTIYWDIFIPILRNLCEPLTIKSATKQVIRACKTSPWDT